MDRQRVEAFKSQYDLVVHEDEASRVEFWYARELMPLLGYGRWENFEHAIERAMDSCKSSGVNTFEHFREVTKTSPMPNGGVRKVKDFMLQDMRVI